MRIFLRFVAFVAAVLWLVGMGLTLSNSESALRFFYPIFGFSTVVLASTMVYKWRRQV